MINFHKITKTVLLYPFQGGIEAIGEEKSGEDDEAADSFVQKHQWSVLSLTMIMNHEL